MFHGVCTSFRVSGIYTFLHNCVLFFLVSISVDLKYDVWIQWCFCSIQLIQFLLIYIRKTSYMFFIISVERPKIPIKFHIPFKNIGLVRWYRQ
jgi:hypothetical protein